MNSDIIEEIVRWRMGSAYGAPILDWRDERLNFDTEFALDVDFAGGLTIERDEARLSAPQGREDYDPTRHKRLVDTTKDILAARAERAFPVSVFLAMQDARLFPSFEYLGPPDPARCAQISYVRTVSEDWRPQVELILWPLTNYVKWWKLPKTTPAPWELRRSELLWRGQPTGMSYELTDGYKPLLIGIRKVRRWLNGWLRDEATGNEECFRRWADSYQRLRATSLCRTIAGTDVRLVPMYDGDRRSLDVVKDFLGADAVSERISGEAYLAMQQQCKYVLSLPGNDCPSSLRQDLLSGSLVLMPRPFWESTWFFGLKPNIHYIPLRADLADLEERLQWCRDNDSQCREITENARAFAFSAFEPSLESKVQSRLIERLAEQTRLAARS